jgi:hypothetical protein
MGMGVTQGHRVTRGHGVRWSRGQRVTGSQGQMVRVVHPCQEKMETPETSLSRLGSTCFGVKPVFRCLLLARSAVLPPRQEAEAVADRSHLWRPHGLGTAACQDRSRVHRSARECCELLERLCPEACRCGRTSCNTVSVGSSHTGG